MCIIAVSKKGVKQPTLDQLRTMFDNNPDGAGYMVARKGKVSIHKGFMVWEDFERAIKAEHFTEKDPVVYHFRISTQAGIKPSMTHPFPLTEDLKLCEKLDILSCPVGIAHNGIIHMTSDSKETRFSDTALFITEYMTKLIRNQQETGDPMILNMIDCLTNSKWAIMNGSGEISLVGKFFSKDGIMYSNMTYLPVKAKGKGNTGKYPTYKGSGSGPMYKWDAVNRLWVETTDNYMNW